ncbi:hypothetical protein [Mycobacterium sp. pR1184]|uniref:hypothetical protein n=1 Tax=Mycobacterium sp. pR1184 TaxID=3238981 RepID=UPI00351B5F2F
MIYGSAGTYVLPIAIEKFAGASELIEICSYRKRILPSPEGIESAVYGGMRELDFGTFEKATELSVFTPKPGLEFLVAAPLFLGKSAVEHYVREQVIDRRDVLDYTSIAIELGVLDSDSASEFLATKYCVPGGVELGIFPKSWITLQLSKMELIGRRFLCLHGDRVRKYKMRKVRTVAFLAECLGSFLLLGHLKEQYSNNIPADIFGYLIVGVEGNSRYSLGVG